MIRTLSLGILFTTCTFGLIAQLPDDKLREKSREAHDIERKKAEANLYERQREDEAIEEQRRADRAWDNKRWEETHQH